MEAWDKALDWVWDLEEDLELISAMAEDLEWASAQALEWAGAEEEDSGKTHFNLTRWLADHSRRIS